MFTVFCISPCRPGRTPEFQVDAYDKPKCLREQAVGRAARRGQHEVTARASDWPPIQPPPRDQTCGRPALERLAPFPVAEKQLLHLTGDKSTRSRPSSEPSRAAQCWRSGTRQTLPHRAGAHGCGRGLLPIEALADGIEARTKTFFGIRPAQNFFPFYEK